MKVYFCREYPEIGRVKCASIAEARKVFNCDCDGKPCCEGPITLEELIAKTQKNVKTWAKNKKNEMDKMYTPGPWKWFSHVEGESEKAKKSGNLRRNWFYELGLENDEGEEVFIVECDGCWSEWLISKANMALIAAAPEMLEALEEVKEYIEHSMNYGILAGVPEFVESAIQKARGEENKPEDDTVGRMLGGRQ